MVNEERRNGTAAVKILITMLVFKINNLRIAKCYKGNLNRTLNIQKWSVIFMGEVKNIIWVYLVRNVKSFSNFNLVLSHKRSSKYKLDMFKQVLNEWSAKWVKRLVLLGSWTWNWKAQKWVELTERQITCHGRRKHLFIRTYPEFQTILLQIALIIASEI